MEVGRGVVEFVAVDVVALVADRPRSMESDAHEKVTKFVTKITHLWISRTSIIAFMLHCRTVVMFDFLPINTHKIAVRVCPKDFTSGEIEGNLFAATGKEPEA